MSSSRNYRNFTGNSKIRESKVSIINNRFYREYFLDNQWNTPDISEEEMEEGKTKILEELR